MKGDLNRQETATLESRWQHLLTGEDSLNPVSMLDHSISAITRPYPHLLKPYTSGSIYDRELKRVKESRDSMSKFIEGQ